MNVKAIVSDLSKDLIRVHGDRLSKHEKAFLLNFEDLGTRVFASGDSVLEMFYLKSRGFMNILVSEHLRQLAHQGVLNDGLPEADPELDLIRLNAFRSHITGLFQRMKETNLL